MCHYTHLLSLPSGHRLYKGITQFVLVTQSTEYNRNSFAFYLKWIFFVEAKYNKMASNANLIIRVVKLIKDDGNVIKQLQ